MRQPREKTSSHRESGWLAYLLGRSLNKNRWDLEQIPYVTAISRNRRRGPEDRRTREEREIKRMKRTLFRRIRVLFSPSEQAVHIERAVELSLIAWHDRINTEDFASGFSEEFDLYVTGALGFPRTEYYDYVRDYYPELALNTFGKIIETLINKTNDRTDLQTAFKLGLTVDLGLRPINICDSIFFEVLEQSSDQSHSEQSTNVFGRQRSPRQYDTRYCSIRRSLVETEWARQVRMLWPDLALPFLVPEDIIELTEPADPLNVCKIIRRLDTLLHSYFMSLENEGLKTEAKESGFTSLKASNSPVHHSYVKPAIVSPNPQQESDFTNLKASSSPVQHSHLKPAIVSPNHQFERARLLGIKKKSTRKRLTWVSLTRSSEYSIKSIC